MPHLLIIVFLLIPILLSVVYLIALSANEEKLTHTLAQNLFSHYLPANTFITPSSITFPLCVSIAQKDAFIDIQNLEGMALVELTLKTKLNPSFPWFLMSMVGAHLRVEVGGSHWSGDVLDILTIFDAQQAKQVYQGLQMARDNKIFLTHWSIDNGTMTITARIPAPHSKEIIAKLPGLLDPLMHMAKTIEQNMPQKPWPFWSMVFANAWHHEDAQSLALHTLMTQCPDAPQTIECWQMALQLARPNVLIRASQPALYTWLQHNKPEQSKCQQLMAFMWPNRQNITPELLILTQQRTFETFDFQTWFALPRDRQHLISSLFEHFWQNPDHRTPINQRMQTWFSWIDPKDIFLPLQFAINDTPHQIPISWFETIHDRLFLEHHHQVLSQHLTNFLSIMPGVLNTVDGARLTVKVLRFASQSDAKQLCAFILHHALPQSYGLLQTALNTGTFKQTHAQQFVLSILPQLKARATVQASTGTLSLSEGVGQLGDISLANGPGQLTQIHHTEEP